METNEQIRAVESNIARLKEQARKFFIPRKSINFQFQHLIYGNRDQTQQAVIQKKQRRKVEGRIESSRIRLFSLRSILLLGNTKKDKPVNVNKGI